MKTNNHKFMQCLNRHDDTVFSIPTLLESYKPMRHNSYVFSFPTFLGCVWLGILSFPHFATPQVRQV